MSPPDTYASGAFPVMRKGTEIPVPLSDKEFKFFKNELPELLRRANNKEATDEDMGKLNAKSDLPLDRDGRAYPILVLGVVRKDGADPQLMVTPKSGYDPQATVDDYAKWLSWIKAILDDRNWYAAGSLRVEVADEGDSEWHFKDTAFDPPLAKTTSWGGWWM